MLQILLLLVMMLMITCVLMLMLMLMLLLLTRLRVMLLLMMLLRVRQSFVLHGGLEAQLLMPGLLLVDGVVEGRVLLLARVRVGVEVGGGEVEQGVVLGEVEVLHGA
jgi:hypothetical protein